MRAVPDIGKRIRVIRKQRGLTQSELGEKIGKAPSTIRGYEKGELQIWRHDDVLSDICRALEVSIEDLTTDDSGEVAGPDIVPNIIRESHGPQYGALKAEETGKLKVYGAISAGDGNTGTIDPDEIDFPQQFARDDYGALWIEGDSMMVGERSGLMPSDLAIFRDWTREKVGRIMAAELPSGEWVVKELVYEDGRFKLRSLNEAYPDIDGPFRLSGFLVGVVRDRGSRRHIILDTAGLAPADLLWGE